MEPHPIRIVVSDDLERSRLTVFFRLLLAFPHLVFLFLWAIAAFFAAIANWFATLVAGRSPEGLHDFLSGFVVYSTHVYAYVFLAAAPFPGIGGEYPVDVEIDRPQPQPRWKTALRLFLAIPALMITGVLTSLPGGGGSSGASSRAYDGSTGTKVWANGGSLAVTIAVLAWFACLARGRMPGGFRDLLVYALRYSAQTTGYLFLLTDRYPNADPSDARIAEAPAQAVLLRNDDDLVRSRLTVFFRLPLAIPHVVWLLLWSLAVLVAALVNWLVTLVRGRSAEPLQRFFSAYLRYSTHVSAFLFLAANPFPGFTGVAGSYPLEPVIEVAERQSRWTVAFRIILAIPALIVSGGLGSLAAVAAVLGWFAAVATGRMPRGLRNAIAYDLRYSAQVNAYAYLLLTDRYPFSGPAAGGETGEEPPAQVGAVAEAA